MRYSKELNIIYNALVSGESFGKFTYWNYYKNEPFQYPFFHTMLYKHYCKNILCWENYGSSANKATKEQLQWIITNIFNTTPKMFIKEYITRTEYERMKTAINACIENGNRL